MLEMLNFILGINGKLRKSFEQRHDINRSVLLKGHLGYRVKNELLRKKIGTIRDKKKASTTVWPEVDGIVNLIRCQ